MTDQAEEPRRPNRLQVIEANLLGAATVGQIAAALGESVEETTATILEMVRGWCKEWSALDDTTQAYVNRRRVDLAINSLWSAKGVQSGDTAAISQLMTLMELRDRQRGQLPIGPFPAGERVPGQSESRAAYARLKELGARIPWWEEYLDIRERLAVRKAAGKITRADWRIAAYIAWASLPTTGRWPETQEELATNVLGLKSDRQISKWKTKYPWLEEEIEFWRVAPLARHRPDVFNALIEVARMVDPKAHSDRKLFLEMTGDYSPRGTLDVRASAAVVGLPVEGLSDEELDAILENFLIAEKHERGPGREVSGDASPGTSGDGAGRSEDGDDD